MSFARVRRNRASAVTRRTVLLLVAIASPALVARAARADTFINFDNLANNTAVDDDYVASGVLFNGVTGIPGSGAHISTGDVTPSSGPNVLISNPFALEFAQGPVTFTFTTPQQTVSLLAGYVQFNSDPPTKTGIMTAFDQNGNVIATDGPKTVNGGRTSTPFSIASTSANIVRVTVATTQFAYTVIDDLRFGGGAVIPPPTGTPVVTIFSPNTQTLDFVNNALQITGTVTGQGLLTTAKATLELLTPPPSLVGFPRVNNGLIPFTVNAAGGGFDSNTAGSTAAFGKLLIGTYKLTVSVTNLAGATGSASVTFTNLPSVVINNANANQFGTFKFAEPSEGGCQMVSYTAGGVAYFPATGTVFVMTNEIATKWFSVLDYSILRGNGRLGCPVAADVFTFESSSQIPGRVLQLRTQDFVRGRIYHNQNVSTAYTAKVFVDAIKGLSTFADPASLDGPALNSRDPLGITEVGIPFADPTFDMFGSNPTILFQRFRRYDYDGLANTLEIRGRNNPRLYIERVGGSILDYVAGVGAPPAVPPTTAQNPNPFDDTPTVWETYDCTLAPQSGLYQCPVARPQVRLLSPINRVPMYTDANQIDNYTAYCPDADWEVAVLGAIPGFKPVAWSAVPLKENLGAVPSIADHTDVLTKGWVTSSRRSGEDLPSVHEHIYSSATADVTAVVITVVGCAIPYVGCVLGALAGNQVAGFFQWSDWNFHIRPLALAARDPNETKVHPPAGDPVPAFWNLLSVTADPEWEHKKTMGDMEIEWEHFWWIPWVNLADNHVPQPGSLVYLNGRWILDCAHPPFHSEIHPPNGFLAMETAKPVPGMQGVDPASPFVTRAQIWVNQLYEGQPFQTVIWPPPRPAPDAELSAFYVVYGPPQGGLMTLPDGSLRFLFTNDAVGDPAMVSPVTSQATSGFVADGISANFSGPSGSHKVEESGQVIMPFDDPDSASGTVGDFMANYYVGWSRQ